MCCIHMSRWRKNQGYFCIQYPSLLRMYRDTYIIQTGLSMDNLYIRLYIHYYFILNLSTTLSTHNNLLGEPKNYYDIT